MLKGDLATTPLASVLEILAGQEATGCLHIDDSSGDEALVYLKRGLAYSVHVPGRRPQLGARLISSGALAPEALEEALEAQATELQGWRLGELLVHLGYVDHSVVENFVLEQLRESIFDLSQWTGGTWKFRKNEKTREEMGTATTVTDLLAEAGRRTIEWETIASTVHGPNAVPRLSSGGVAAAEFALDQDQWALLCKVDGERTIAQLARDCGFTTFEAGQIVFSLAGAGLLDVEETVVDEPADEPELPPSALAASIAAVLATEEAPDDLGPLSRITSALFVPLAPDETGQPAGSEAAESELSRLLSESADPLTASFADLPSLARPVSLEPDPIAGPAPLAFDPVAADDPFADSLARVSEALATLLGDDALPLPPPRVTKEPERDLAAERRAAEEAARQERIRAAAAAELAEAHAQAEASKNADPVLAPALVQAFSLDEPAVDVWPDVDLAAAQLAAEQLAAEQLAAEQLAAAAARQEAEQLAAERRAAEDAERTRAERAAAEAARKLAKKRQADRRVAEEAARLEAERLAAAAAEAERLAAERREAERIAAAVAAEAARLAEEAERLEAERLEAERLAAEQLAAETAALEAERAAAEAARLAAEFALDVTSAPVELVPELVPVVVEPESPGRFAEEFAALTALPIEVVEDVGPEQPPAPAPAVPAASVPGGLSETAALMRELSSLGLDDDAEPVNGNASRLANAATGTAPTAVRPVPKDAPKKRKGLFGR